MFVKVIGYILLIWLACLIIGAVFGVLGKIVWIAILGTLIATVWGYVKRDR